MTEQTHRLQDIILKWVMIWAAFMGATAVFVAIRSDQTAGEKAHQEVMQALQQELKLLQDDQKLRQQELKKISSISNKQQPQALPPVVSEWDNWNIVDPRTEYPHQPPDVSAPKLGLNGQPTPPFITTHLWFLGELQKVNPNLVFLGDSITEAWKRCPSVWDAAFGRYKPFNLGIGGDRTQHVIWRISNGEFEGIRPKVAIVMIGTNNLSSDPPEKIASGIARVVQLIREKSPTTKVLLLGIFPRSETADSYRKKASEVNSIIAQLGDERNVFFLDIGNRFLQPDGTLSKDIMPDFLHPSAKGYEIWADAMGPTLDKLMK